MKRVISRLSVVALACVLAACNNSNNSPFVTPTPCPTPSGDTTVLVYPAPGATNVSGTFGQVIIASTTALPSNYDVIVTDALNPAPGGVLGGDFTAASPPFPSPNTTPSFGNPQYQSSSFSGITFASGQVVTVFINDQHASCTPVGPVGSFST
jgi:hypothetical protein